MKYLLILLLSTTTLANECTESTEKQTNKVAYNVNKDMPDHLKGATITITLANGKSSTVPANKFMVVPRKQYTVVGESVNMTKTMTCKSKSKKNNISLDVRKDVVGLDKSSTSIANGTQAKVLLEKDLIPTFNYYRREVLGDALGFGAGIDTNGVLKGIIGLDF
jgi:hypothetical protein